MRQGIYVITEPCVGVKDKACVPTCPVDCIHEAETMLYIDPDKCICCAGCVDVCPVDAIYTEDEVPKKWRHYIPLNAELARSGCRCHPPQASSGSA
jgi:NAD-dependent dihydropyrimidine dehydrogenase PreA subunit